MLLSQMMRRNAKAPSGALAFLSLLLAEIRPYVELKIRPRNCRSVVVIQSALPIAVFQRLQALDAEIVQEPTDQPYGVRDFGVRDPAGNMIRIQQMA
ncbi:VOC family protein [Denitromonas halophila]|uniref:VOC family protein n=1 Tax=Denitromonas halophila TaxID=1629404 RepID=UPI001C8FFDF9|nr:VOC family protein [Denitromonas halophila]